MTSVYLVKLYNFLGKFKKYFVHVIRKNFRKRIYFGRSLKMVLELGNIFYRLKNVRKGLEKTVRLFCENLTNISGKC